MNAKETRESTYRQIDQEHSEICELATTLLRILVEQQQPADRVSHLFGLLCERVRWHFADEESAGMFEQIAQSAPRLGPAAQGFRQEHDALLQRLECLRDAACQGELTRDLWDELERGFRQFIQQLARHEYQESEARHSAWEQSPEP